MRRYAGGRAEIRGESIEIRTDLKTVQIHTQIRHRIAAVTIGRIGQDRRRRLV